MAYKWWLNTWGDNCDFEQQPGSNVLGFVVAPCTGGPTLYSPNGDTPFGIPPEFSWQDKGAGSTYQILAWTVAGGGSWLSLYSPWYDSSNCNGTICSATPPSNFVPGTSWWWLNIWTADCDFQQQPGGNVMPIVVKSMKPTASISASAACINRGDNATITWSSIAATSCTIRSIQSDNITVGPKGSITVTPQADTTYTIIASGPGGVSDPASVTVKIKPTVTLSASPASIIWGGTARLSWTSTGASSYMIQPGNITVETDTTVNVSPTANTTYTIIAHGPNCDSDPATAQVAVVIVKPTVLISADPPAIESGQSTTLSWRATGAETCSVQPGGYTETSGSKQLTLTQPTMYTITATGPDGGTATGSVTVQMKWPGAIHITSPETGDSINRPDTLVKGTITASAFSDTDIGVVVNGVVAHVYNGEFAANHVPLSSGANTITAMATTISGDNATASVTVSADTSGNYITLTSNPESGIASDITPLDFTLKLARTYDNGTYSFSYAPDNRYPENISDNGTLMEFKRRITEPGLYYITAQDNETVDNVTKVLHSDTLAVMAESRSDLDTKLKAKWNGQNNSLLAGFAESNIEKSLTYISVLSNDKYRDAYTQLLAQLPAIAQDLQPRPLELIYVNRNIAKYRMYKGTAEVDGVTVPITYYIYFIKDMDGLWKIDQY